MTSMCRLIRGVFISAFFVLFQSTTALAAGPIILSDGGDGTPYHNATRTGYLDVLLKEAFKRTGHPLKIVDRPGERSLLDANLGRVDGDTNRVAGLQKLYPNLVQVPEKLFDWKFVAFSNQKLNLSKGWQALKPHSISYITGWKIFEANIPKGTNAIAVRNVELLFSLLQKNRAELILYESLQGQQYAREHNMRGIKMIEPPLAHRAKFLYLNKKYIWLVPQLATALRAMKRDGTYKRIINQTLGSLRVTHLDQTHKNYGSTK